MAYTYDRRKVIAVACPRCEAKAGERCRSASGKRTSDEHTARKGKVYPSFLQGVSGGPKRGVRQEDPNEPKE